MPGTEIHIERGAWRVMVEHAQACLPEEACGMLAGHGTSAEQIIPVENVKHSSTRYRMQPQAQIEAMLGLEKAGMELVGIFHSHPSGPEVLSPTDLREARYPECVYLVLSPASGSWHGRAFRVDLAELQPVQLVISETGTSEEG